jgi:hypothetical protein
MRIVYCSEKIVDLNMSILEIINSIVIGLIICFSFYRYKEGKLLPIWIGFVIIGLLIVDTLLIVYNI